MDNYVQLPIVAENRRNKDEKFLIKDINVGISEGGIACGPVPGNVIGEVTLQSEDGTVVYHSLAEVEGTLNFYKSEESTYERQLSDNFDDDFIELMDNCCSGGYNSYAEFYGELNEQLPLNNSNLIRKYLAYMVSADWDKIHRMKEETIGKYIGEFEIPVCDAETEYLDEYEPDEEE